jgi:hypothetical protein
MLLIIIFKVESSGKDRVLAADQIHIDCDLSTDATTAVKFCFEKIGWYFKLINYPMHCPLPLVQGFILPRPGCCLAGSVQFCDLDLVNDSGVSAKFQNHLPGISVFMYLTASGLLLNNYNALLSKSPNYSDNSQEVCFSSICGRAISQMAWMLLI